MSEDNTTFSHSSLDQRVRSDVDTVRSTIDALQADVERVVVMTPLDHLDWALASTLCWGISRPPEMLRRAVHRSRAFGHRGLEAYRQKTLASWFERKRVLDPVWQHLWELCQSEVESGKASEVPLAEVVKRCVVTPHFPVDEGWRWKDDNWVRRVRCIDDFTASFINVATAAGESIHHDTLDVLVVLLHSAGEDREPVRFRKNDFVGAHKTLPLRLEETQLPVTVYRDASGSLRTLHLHCCPFGAVAPPRGCCAVYLGQLVSCCLRSLRR